MVNDPSHLKEELRQSNREFRKLEGEHHRLDEELKEMVRRKTLTPKEEIHKKRIQVEKLHTKDRIEALLRRHRDQQRSV